jgi:AAA+ superfamily predicted ATPase
MGHGKLAEELRDLIDKARIRVPSGSPSPIPLARPRGEVADLLTVSYPTGRLTDLILALKTRKRLERVIREHKTIRDIRAHGLAPRKKLLLLGPPGTGKTTTASIIAGELGSRIQWTKLASRAQGLSYADITRATEDALRHALIEHRALTHTDLAAALVERQSALNHGAAKA